MVKVLPLFNQKMDSGEYFEKDILKGLPLDDYYFQNQKENSLIRL